MRDGWRNTIGVLLATTALLGAAHSQTARSAAERNDNSRVACDAFTLDGLAPGMTYTEVEEILRARSPRPRSAGRYRRYHPGLGWQAVHGWHVPDGTIEVWYAGKKANRKKNPTAVRVRLLVPEDSVSVEALWKSVFDRFGPMSNWEREDCDIKAVVGLDKDRPHTTLTLLSWERASTEADE